MHDDKEIIDLFRQRDQEAVRKVSQVYGTLCRRVIRGILTDRCDVEECLQDTWLALWNAIPPAQPDPLSAFVCRVARNQALKLYRADTAQKRNSRYDAALEELEGCIPAAQTVEQETDARILTGLLNTFLVGLAADDRILFLRRYWYGDDLKTLATQMGITRNNTAVRLSRLRGKLKAFLEQEGYTL